jgi:multiple sugar transport system permease protein
MRVGASLDNRPWWRSHLRRQEVLVAYLFILPWIIGFLVFTAGPILVSFALSFTQYKIITPATAVGLDNYAAMIRDRNFWQSLRVTTIYTLGSVPLNVVVGYLLALMLNQKIKGLSFWRTTFFMPSVVPILAVSYLFAWMLNPNIGLVNGLLRQVGIQGPEWFSSREWVIPSFIIMSLWGVGGGMVLYLAALQGVPTALYDAAKADGANAWHRFYHVTLPMTSPVIFFNFLMGLIGSFQVFASAFFVTAGGPANASLFYVLYLFRNGWEYFRMGYASALAWVLFLIIMAATLVSFKLSGRFVYYETSET